MSMSSSTRVQSRARGRRRPVVRRRSRAWLGWLAAISWALASTAWAAEPPASVRYTRAPIKVRPAKDPKAQVMAAHEAASEVPRGPSSAGSPFGRPTKAIELAAIDDQLRLLGALLQEASLDDKDYPDYLFRYASLHLDRKAIFEDQAGMLYAAIHAMKEAGKPEEAQRLVTRQRALQRKAHAASEAAVKAFATLVQGRFWAG